MERTKALVTPEVMKWARELARLDVDTAAKEIGRPLDEIRGWEDGTVVPTMAQARDASEVYQRSLAVFYLPEPPKDFDTLKDFRTLPSTADAGYSPELALLVRRLQARQEWLREYRLSEGYERLKIRWLCIRELSGRSGCKGHQEGPQNHDRGTGGLPGPEAGVEPLGRTGGGSRCLGLPTGRGTWPPARRSARGKSRGRFRAALVSARGATPWPMPYERSGDGSATAGQSPPATPGDRRTMPTSSSRTSLPTRTGKTATWC